MTNADKIRQMNDEQLARFLWIWKINSITTFLTQGGMNSMDAKDMREWVGQTTETFVCTETFVGDDYIFDQDFNDKADRKTEPTISKMEQVEDEPQTCDNCKLKGSTKWCNNQVVCRAYKPMDEPQTHDICTNTHECVKDTHDKTESNSEKPNNSTISKMEQVEDDAYFLKLMGAVERGEISDAGANQAWYEHINHKDEPQTDCPEYHNEIECGSCNHPQTDCPWR